MINLYTEVIYIYICRSDHKLWSHKLWLILMFEPQILTYSENAAVIDTDTAAIDISATGIDENSTVIVASAAIVY